MYFPELNRYEKNSLKPSKEFLYGMVRRCFSKPKGKIFVIGFHKTGTSSMGKALQVLGCRVCGSLKEGYGVKGSNKTLNEYLIKKAEGLFIHYDAFQDTPWFLMYEELYGLYPNAKFILTIRDENKWIESVQTHFGVFKFPYHNYIYETENPIKNENIYRERYNFHNENVIRFFQNHNKEILVIDLAKEEHKWERICKYLNVSRPHTAFPHANKSGYGFKTSSKIKKILKKIYFK